LTEKIKLYLVYGISLAFVALNVFLFLKEQYWALVLPVAVVVLLMYIFALDKLILLIVFLTPLAVNITSFDVGLGVSLPTEPLMFGVLIIFILKLFSGSPYDRKIIYHPVSIAVLFSLGWMLVTTFTSEVPLVSLKYLVARLWFVIPFYFVGIILFKQLGNVKRFSWLYVISLIIVVVYTVANHAKYGFNEETGHWVMTPFYNDHTAYGAALAFFIPVMLGFSLDSHYKKSIRYIAFAFFVVLFVAIILSYSRAAWISVIASFMVYAAVMLRLKFKWIALTTTVLIVMFFSFQHQILEVLERNEQDSSTDMIEHVQSIYNISSNASNLERINRWQAAIRMFEERPFLGWGPGTYQFVYAPFQRSKEKTIISTNAGDLGNSHNEYLGPLSEQGVLGLVGVLLIMIFSVYTALKVHKFAIDKEVRLLSLITLLALVTYFTHGMLNNFLDTDKASVPVWGFLAMVVALDLYHKDRLQETD
jgi:O-antigen ligase